MQPVGPASAASVKSADRTAINALLYSYRQAWEAKDPFALIRLSPRSSPVFNDLLNYERFDHIKLTSVRLGKATISHSKRRDADFAVRFVKTHEDLFLVGTVTKGVTEVTLHLRRAARGSVVVVGREFKSLSDQTATERLFYDGYKQLMNGQFSAAVQLLEQAIKLPDSDALQYIFGNRRFRAQLHFFAGVARWKLRQFDQARALFELAVASNPRFPAALNYLGLCYARVNTEEMLTKALQQWKKSLAYYPDQPQIRDAMTFHGNALKHYSNTQLRGLYLAIRGMPPQKALTALTQLLYLDQSNVETKRLIAVNRLRNNEFAEAQKILLKLYLVESPKDPESAYLLGRLAIAMNQHDTALKWFNVLWNEKRNYRDTLIFLSDLNGRAGRFRNAISYLKEALKSNPGSAAILYKLGFYHLKLKDLPAARNYFEGCKRANPPLTIRKAIYKLRRSTSL